MSDGTWPDRSAVGADAALLAKAVDRLAKELLAAPTGTVTIARLADLISVAEHEALNRNGMEWRPTR